MYERITLREKVGYGLGDMASSMFWKIFGMYLLFFYTDVFGISAAAAGTLFLLTRIWDAVNDPLMGIITDRTKNRLGKYRPYILWFALPFAIAGVLTFYTPNLGASGKLIYAYLTYTLMMMVYTAVNVPYASLLGVMSHDSRQRNILSSYRMSFAFIGSFITFMLFQPLIDWFGGDAVPAAWTKAVAIIGAICMALFFLTFKWTRERVQPVDRRSENTSIRRDLTLLLKNRPWWILVATGLAALMFNAIRDTVAIYYFKYYAVSDYRMPRAGWDIATIYFLVGQAANLVGVVLAAPLSNRFGKRPTYITAMLTAAALSLFFCLLKPTDLVAVLSLQTLVSVCAGVVLPLLWSMFSDICDYQEWKTGRRATGLIFSSSSMSQKFGWAIGPALVGWMLAAFGYVAPTDGIEAAQPDSVIFGIKLMLSWLPALACLFAAAGMFFYPLTDRKVKEISSALEKLRKNDV
jgi:GPH family glycoside/pentoside/hexuronide:cation symporter